MILRVKIKVLHLHFTFTFNEGLLSFSPGACFSKVSKLFGRITGGIIFVVSSKRRRLEARNFAVIFILFPLQHMKRPGLQNKQVVVLRMAFRARKVFGTLEKRAPVVLYNCLKVIRTKQQFFIK